MPVAAVGPWPLGPKHPPTRSSRAAEKRETRAAAKAAGAKSGKQGWGWAIAALLLVVVLAGAGGGYYYFMMDLADLIPSQAPRLDTKTTPGLSPPGGAARPAVATPGVLPPMPAPPRPTPSVTPPAPSSPTPLPGPNTATLPRPEVPTSVHTAERIKRYVEQYDGGDCFFIVPVAIGEKRAAIEGFGASLQPFNTLDETFKRDIGFTADIGVRQVTNQQCPAVTFLGRLRNERARAPRLDVDKSRLRSGEVLNGTVDRFGSRNIELLLVSDTGTVQNISNLLKQGIDAKSFNIGMQHRGDAAGSLPQLLVAIVTPQPLRVLQITQPTGADQLFPGIWAEATQTKQVLGVTAKYFRLDR